MNPGHEVALAQVVQELHAARSAGEKLAAACRVLQALPHYTGVYLYALEGDTLVLRAFHGRATEHTRIPSGQGICGAIVLTGAPVTVADGTRTAPSPRWSVAAALR